MNVTNMGCQEFELHLNLVGVSELFSASISAGRFECQHSHLDGRVREAS